MNRIWKINQLELNIFFFMFKGHLLDCYCFYPFLLVVGSSFVEFSIRVMICFLLIYGSPLQRRKSGFCQYWLQFAIRVCQVSTYLLLWRYFFLLEIYFIMSSNSSSFPPQAGDAVLAIWQNTRGGFLTEPAAKVDLAWTGREGFKGWGDNMNPARSHGPQLRDKIS